MAIRPCNTLSILGSLTEFLSSSPCPTALPVYKTPWFLVCQFYSDKRSTLKTEEHAYHAKILMHPYGTPVQPPQYNIFIFGNHYFFLFHCSFFFDSHLKKNQSIPCVHHFNVHACSAFHLKVHHFSTLFWELNDHTLFSEVIFWCSPLTSHILVVQVPQLKRELIRIYFCGVNLSWNQDLFVLM